MRKRVYALAAILILALGGCTVKPGQTGPSSSVAVDPEAHTLAGRFSAPPGYERVAAEDNSFGAYLRTLPLKEHGTKVKYYSGETKNRDVYEAVIDLDTGKRDLQQCADSIIRLRAEYLYWGKKYDDIHFNFTSGFPCEYAKWREGYRVVVRGNSAAWVKTAAYSGDYKAFRAYLDTVFAYAGTLSLEKELVLVSVDDMQIGDIFIQGGSPGHCVIVTDMAVKTENGEKIFMLAQGYMPAQDMHILKNPQNTAWSPWYSANFGAELNTPEWTFQKADLRRFK